MRAGYLGRMSPVSFSPFRPTKTSNLKLWLDGADGNTFDDPTAIGQMDDKSGNGNHVTQGTESAQPDAGTATLNNKSVVTYDGGDTLSIPSGLFSVPNGNNTLFIVAKTSLDTTRQRIIGMTEAAGARYLLEFSAVSGNMLWQSRNASGSGVTLTGVTKTNFNIFTCFRSGTTQSISANGGTPATNTSGVDEAGIDRADISGADGASLFVTGDIAEVLIYDKAFSASETTITQSYLSNKWGVALA